jgi:hypothetical protein
MLNKVWEQTDKECPLCGENVYTIYQPPIVQREGRTGHHLHHCENEACKGYKRTKSSYEEYVKCALSGEFDS